MGIEDFVFLWVWGFCRFSDRFLRVWDGYGQWRRQDFVTGGEVWVYRGSRVRSPPEADTFTAVHSSMTMKAHTYYVIFGRPPIGGSLPPLAAPLGMGIEIQSPRYTYIQIYIAPKIVRTNLRRWHRMTRR